MRRIRRFLAYLCTLAVLITSVPQTVAFAATSDEALYTQMFSTRASAYYMTCQPASAIILNDTISLTPSMVSVNYKGGVVDLPRLQAQYYYKLSTENSEYMLGDTLYPTLMWNDAAIGTETSLSICSEQTDASLLTINIYIDSSRAASMRGIDYWYKVEHHDIDASGNDNVTYTVEFKDCSKNVVNTLVDEAGGMRHYTFTSGSFTIYDPAMHKKCIVMDKYAYTPDNVSAYTRLKPFSSDFVYESFDEQAYTFAQNEGTLINQTTDIKKHLGTLNTGTRAGLLFYGSKTDDCAFNNNEGIATTVTDITDTENLYYFIALSSGCYFSRVRGSVANKELAEVVSGEPSMTWSADKTYSLQSGTDWLAAGFTGNPSTTNTNYLNYGPVSFDDFNETVKAHNVTVSNDGYDSTHTLANSVDGINVFASSLIYSASIPHLGKLTLQKAMNTITVNYYYQLPDSETWTLLGQSVVYNAAQFATTKLEEMPDVVNYDSLCWYTDPNLSTKINQSSYSKTATQAINLYGGYVYSGGYYTVTFYDDYNNTTTTEQFKVNEQPSLPETPKGASGKGFKQWTIVNSKSDTSGIAYTADTFKPTSNANYIFKTTWDTKGIITSVEYTKTQYYLGQELDLDDLKVYYKSDDTGETKLATTNEYTLSKTVVNLVGANAITVTLNSTSYQYTFIVYGVKRDVQSITATYSGGDVKVGTELQPGAFTVTLQYADDSTTTTTDFTLSPSYVKKTGKNTVLVKYMDLQTTCTVTGIEADEYKEEADLSYITAKYVGGTIWEGDEISASDLQVVAYYENGRKVTLDKTDFTFSPNSFYSGGKQLIMCSYNGQTATTSVYVLSILTDDTTPSDTTSTPSDTSTTPSTGNNTSSNGSSGGSGSSNSGSSNNSSSSTTPDYTYTPDTTYTPSTSDSNTSNDNTYTPSNNGSDTSSNDASSSGGSSSSSSNDGKGTSIGYLSGANILTNVNLGGLSSPLGTETMAQQIDDAENGESVFITLTNGYNGNQVTVEEMNLIRDKNLVAYITMTDPSDNMTPVAEWVINGAEATSIGYSINPNINFEVTDQDDGRLVYFATAQTDYPAGVSLTVIPSASYYETGELLRLYSCTADYGNASSLRAFTWMDTSNMITVDLTTKTSYCLSNALGYADEGSNLLNSSTTTEEEPASDVGEESTEFNWDDIPESSTSNAKSILSKVLIVLGIVAGVALVAVIGILVASKIRSASLARKAYGGSEDSDSGDYSVDIGDSDTDTDDAFDEDDNSDSE